MEESVHYLCSLQHTEKEHGSFDSQSLEDCEWFVPLENLHTKIHQSHDIRILFQALGAEETADDCLSQVEAAQAAAAEANSELSPLDFSFLTDIDGTSASLHFDLVSQNTTTIKK